MNTIKRTALAIVTAVALSGAVVPAASARTVPTLTPVSTYITRCYTVWTSPTTSYTRCRPVQVTSNRRLVVIRHRAF